MQDAVRDRATMVGYGHFMPRPGHPVEGDLVLALSEVGIELPPPEIYEAIARPDPELDTT
jgi:hypothetical protein